MLDRIAEGGCVLGLTLELLFSLDPPDHSQNVKHITMFLVKNLIDPVKPARQSGKVDVVLLDNIRIAIESNLKLFLFLRYLDLSPCKEIVATD